MGTEREAWQLLPGRSLKTVALLPAARARCIECLKLLAKPGAYQYDKLEEQTHLTGPSPMQ